MPTKKEVKRRERRYTENQKQQALVLLEQNKGNALKTARELNIPRSTLTQWRDEFELIKEEIVSDESGDEYVTSVAKIRHVNDQVAKDQSVDILDMSYNLAKLAHDRMTVLIPIEDDLHKVAGALKIAGDYHSKITTAYQEDKGQGQGVNFFTQINNNYK